MNRVTRITLILFVLFLFAAPALAQEVTATPLPDVVPVVPTDDTVTLPSWFIANLAALFVGFGSLTTIVAMVLNNRSASKTLERVDKSHKDALEAAYLTIPPHVQDSFARISDFTENALMEVLATVRFIREVTDGKPNSEPPTILGEPLTMSGTPEVGTQMNHDLPPAVRNTAAS